MLGLELKEIIPIVVSTASGIYIGYKEVKEKRRSKLAGLDPNPERCEKHETRLGRLELSCATMLAHITNMQDDISWLRSKVDKNT